jgi:glycosyltransferase involved in cell wall biosynthesis
LIKEGKEGYLFESNNPPDLAKKISLGINNKKIGKKARKSVEQFSWPKIIRKIEGLF